MSEELADLENWRDYIPQEYRETSLVEDTKSIGDLAKQAVDLQRINGGMLRIPTEDASDEVKADFRGKLEKVGMVPLKDYQEYVRPKTADQYSLTTPPADAVELSLTQGMVDQWKDDAFKDGLSPEQFEARAQRTIDSMRANRDLSKQTFQNQEEALRNEWGPHGYEANKQRALSAAMRFGGQGMYDSLKDNPDPMVLKALGEVGKQFEEQGMGDLQQPLSLPETRDEANAKLGDILGNPEHPFNKGPMGAGGAAYAAASKEVMRLKRITMGESANAADDMFASG